MLSFLRLRRAQPSPPPSCAAMFDGAVLSLPATGFAEGDEIALDLDGVHFTSATATADGVRFAFPFAPEDGNGCVAVARQGRDGIVVAGPLELRFGVAGIGVAPDGGETPAPLAPLALDAERLVPAGIDCAAREVAIVVPVHDAPDDVERCLAAVLEHTTGRARLIVIDDASRDAAIAPLLARHARIAGVTVLRNETNRGFTATANRGIAEAGADDVVLLNADTEVGPAWLAGLRRAAYSADDVATATAVSDNAGAFSVPELERENAMPPCWSLEDTARALWQGAGRAYPELPSGNGFCLYIRRSVLDAVGALDEAAFPQGYGEENDFCQRASARGLRHVIAGNVFVRHARSRSYGHERRIALGVAGMAILRERWPSYEADVAATLYSYPRRVLDWRVRRIYAGADANSAPRRRVLVVGDADVVSHRNELRRDGTLLPRSGAAANGGHADVAIDEAWAALQHHAIEAVAFSSSVHGPVAAAARALDIPIARIAPETDADAAIDAAIASARSFGAR